MTVSYTAWWARQSVSAVLNVTPDIATINQGSQSSILGVNPTTTATVRRLFGAASTSTLSPSLSGDADLTRATSGSLVVVPEVFPEMVSLVSGAAIVSPQSTAEAVRTRFASATMNVVPAATVAMQRGNDLGAALTVTPAISAGRQFKAVGTGQLNATPSVAAQANSLQLINSSLPVSPAIVAGAVAGLTGAVNAVPSISAAATSSSAVSATVNAAPTVSGAASPIRLVSASATVTPALDAQRIYTASGAALVLATPAFDPQTVASATLLGSMSAALSVNPTVAAGSVSGNTSTLNAVPVISAAGVRTVSGSAALIESTALTAAAQKVFLASGVASTTPTISSVGKAIRRPAGSATPAPTISASATVTPAAPAGPAFDAIGAGGNSASMSWVHDATGGSYVLVWISAPPYSAYSPPTVTYAGASMSALANVNKGNNVAAGTLYLFGIAAAPGGPQNVNVNMALGGYTVCESISYSGISSVSTPTTKFGVSQVATQSDTCAGDQIIVLGLASNGYSFTGSSGGTSRYIGDDGTSQGLVIQDSPSSATFTATQAGASSGYDQWAGISIILS